LNAPMNIQEPIVIIGAGRSGSTLLTRILNAHPEIDFKGENDFLLPRLWLEAWENRFWLNWERHVAMDPKSALTPLPKLSESALEVERARVGKLVAELVVDMLRVDTRSASVWGYKEPWNGSSSFRFDWNLYDAVLPGALWVHLVRHPFAFARSAAQWDREAWTLPYLRARLNDWKTMVEHNRLRASTGRFCEIRFEDLTRDMHGTLLPVFERARIQWHEACTEAGALRVMASQPGEGPGLPVQLAASDLDKIVEETAGLRDLMTELNYAAPETLEVQEVTNSTAPRQTITHLRNPEGDWSEQCPPRFVLDRRALEAEERLRRTLGELAESETRQANRAAQLAECRMQLGDTRAQLAASQAREADGAVQLAECRRLLERLPEPQRAVAERLTAFPRLTAFLARVLRASA